MTGIAYMVGMTLSKIPLKLIALRPDFFEAPVPPRWGRRLTNKMLGLGNAPGKRFRAAQI